MPTIETTKYDEFGVPVARRQSVGDNRNSAGGISVGIGGGGEDGDALQRTPFAIVGEWCGGGRVSSSVFLQLVIDDTGPGATVRSENRFAKLGSQFHAP